MAVAEASAAAVACAAAAAAAAAAISASSGTGGGGTSTAATSGAAATTTSGTTAATSIAAVTSVATATATSAAPGPGTAASGASTTSSPGTVGAGDDATSRPSPAGTGASATVFGAAPLSAAVDSQGRQSPSAIPTPTNAMSATQSPPRWRVSPTRAAVSVPGKSSSRSGIDAEAEGAGTGGIGGSASEMWVSWVENRTASISPLGVSMVCAMGSTEAASLGASMPPKSDVISRSPAALVPRAGSDTVPSMAAALIASCSDRRNSGTSW